MLGTTHQMVALLTALWWLITYPLSLGPVVGTMSVIAVMVGALTPDLDHPTANIWRRLLGGRAIGNIFQAFSGGHRHMTHSVLGMVGIGWLTHWLMLTLLTPSFHDEARVIWFAFMIGYISHPIADTLTDIGVPWFWPLKWHIRIPPGPEEVRVTTGSLVERLLVRGGILVAAGFLLSRHWPILLGLFR